MPAHSGPAVPVFHPLCPGFLSQSQHSASLCHGGSVPCSQTGDEQKETKNKCLMTHTIHPVVYSLCLSPFTQKQKERDKNHCRKRLEKLVEQKELHLFRLFYSFTKRYSLLLFYFSSSNYIPHAETFFFFKAFLVFYDKVLIVNVKGKSVC